MQLNQLYLFYVLGIYSSAIFFKYQLCTLILINEFFVHHVHLYDLCTLHLFFFKEKSMLLGLHIYVLVAVEFRKCSLSVAVQLD